jgi:hypothetical protein
MDEVFKFVDTFKEFPPRSFPPSFNPANIMEQAPGMSALSPEADMLIVGIKVCYVPIADISSRLHA